MNDEEMDKLIQENHWNKFAVQLNKVLDEAIIDMVKSGELLIFHKDKSFNGENDEQPCYIEVRFED